MSGMRILKSTFLDARRALQLYTIRRLLFRLVSTLLCLLTSQNCLVNTQLTAEHFCRIFYRASKVFCATPYWK